MDLLGKKIIQPSSSEWAAVPVICMKKDEKISYCMDYRKLNSVAHKDALPLPRIASCIDQLRGSTFISCLDVLRDRQKKKEIARIQHMGRGNQTSARQITMERPCTWPIIRIQCIFCSFIQQSTLLHGNKTTKNAFNSKMK